MDKLIYRKTLASGLLFAVLFSFGQKRFDSNIAAAQFDAGRISITGYKTGFDFEREDVRRGWWKYAKQFGNPLDMRIYYQVKIPSETTDGNVDLLIFSQTVYENGESVFSLGLENDKYDVQIQKLLVDFKSHFYINHYLREIKLKQLDAQRLSEEYATSFDQDKKKELLDSIKNKENEVEELKEQIRKIGS